LVADNVAHAADASILLLARGVFAGMRKACGRGETDTQTHTHTPDARDHNTFRVVYDLRET